MMLAIKEKKEGFVFKVRVQPRSSKNMLVGLMGDALKVKLTAAPVGNAANKQCIEFLADCLEVTKSMLQITAGHTSRTKQILLRYPPDCINDKQRDRVRRRIIALLLKDKNRS